MKVTKRTVWKLEIKRDCGCKVSGEYFDELYTCRVGESVFTPCSQHEEHKELLLGFMLEILEQEIKNSHRIPSTPTETAKTEVDPVKVETAETETAEAEVAPARTLRTSGSSESARARPVRTVKAAGSHRPTGRSSSGMGIRRIDAGSNVSPAAQQLMARKSAPSHLELDLESNVKESQQVTKLLDLALAAEDEDDLY